MGVELQHGYKFHPAYPNEIIHLIGIVAIEGAHLDLLLGSTLAALAGGDADVHDNPAYKTGTREKVDQIRKMPGLPAQIAEAMGYMKDIIADRNFAIHGFTSRYTEGSGRVDRDHSMIGKYATLDGSVDRDQAWFENLLNRIYKVNKILIDEMGIERAS